jgi:hypothetical protein
MSQAFFERPILNSPYGYPSRHWELDASGQPTQQIIESRRKAEFVTPIPQPKKKSAKAQVALVLDEGKGISTAAQGYDIRPIIAELRTRVDQWRQIPNPNDWRVTREAARPERPESHEHHRDQVPPCARGRRHVRVEPLKSTGSNSRNARHRHSYAALEQ